MDNIKILTKYSSNLHFDLYCAYHTKCMKDIWFTSSIQRLNYCKFYLPLEGICNIMIDNREYEVHANQLILIPANKEHSYCIKEGDSMTKMWCHFNAYIGERNIFDIIKCNYIIDAPATLINLFENLINVDEKQDSLLYQLTRQGILTQILAQYLELSSYQYIENNSENKFYLENVLSYMEAHLNENLTIKQMSDLVHMNPNYFIQVFTKNFGVSPIKMMNTIKLKHIKNLLANTDITITEIAFQMGFDDVAYFSNFTKKYLGFSPRAYRIYVRNNIN